MAKVNKGKGGKGKTKTKTVNGRPKARPKG